MFFFSKTLSAFSINLITTQRESFAACAQSKSPILIILIILIFNHMTLRSARWLAFAMLRNSNRTRNTQEMRLMMVRSSFMNACSYCETQSIQFPLPYLRPFKLPGIFFLLLRSGRSSKKALQIVAYQLIECRKYILYSIR